MKLVNGEKDHGRNLADLFDLISQERNPIQRLGSRSCTLLKTWQSQTRPISGC